MTDRPIAIGSRGSALALVQARLVADAFERTGQPSRIVIVETDGDRRAPDTAWGEGAFVTAIETALLEGRVDVAVHSAKDVPTDEDPRLRIGAYLPRADPRDALVVRADARERTLEDLPAGSRVGTDSPRRTGFIRARRPDLDVHPLHGNVDTRLRRLDTGETDALVLACAGLDRLGRADRIAVRLESTVVPPAPGQGAIAVQVRAGETRMETLAATIDDAQTRQCVEAERALLRASGGGCRAPLGALATVVDGGVELLVGMADPDGSGAAFAGGHAEPTAIAALLPGLLATVARASEAAPRVLVTRSAEQSASLIDALRVAGLAPVAVPTIAIESEAAGGELDDAARRLAAYRWIVLTSANGAAAILTAADRVGATPTTADRATHWAAIGARTRAVLERAGIEVAFQPGDANREALAAGIPLEPGERVLVVRGDLAGDGLAAALRGRGALVDDVIAYRTREAPPSSRMALRAALATGDPAAVVFTSGSTVRGLVSLAADGPFNVTAIPAMCIGPETAAVARAAGFTILAVATTTDVADLADTTGHALRAGSAATVA